MGFFDIFKPVEEEKEDIEQRSGISSITSILNGSSGMTIEQVEKIPAVQACSSLITNTIASLPVYLYREDEKGNITRVRGDYREFLLNNEPNLTVNAFNMKKQLAKDFIFLGGSYLKVDWENNQIQELWNLKSDKVQTIKYQDGYKTSSRIKYLHNCDLEFDADEVVQVLNDSYDGATTKGLLHTGIDTFTVALNEIDYTKNVYSRGALPMGVLKSASRLSNEALSRLKTAWQNLYSGVKNSGNTVILEEGLTYEPISLDPDKLKLSESKKHTTAEICRLFNVPQSLIDSSANKYGSLEQNNIDFIQKTLTPILSNIETAFNKALLLESEKKDGYFFVFDTSEIGRGTEKEQYEALKVGLDAGIVSVNEARAKMNLKPVPDDILKWSLGSVLYYLNEDDKNARMFIPNMATSVDKEGNIDNGKVNSSNTSIGETLTETGK